MVKFESLSKEKNLICLASERKDGNMSLMVANTKGEISNNRARFLKKYKIPTKNTVFARLDHHTNIFEVKDFSRPGVADALITTISGICLLLSAGDCLPVIYWDKEQKVLAISHNGWRGTLAWLTSKVLGKMKNDFGSNPENILIGIGPCICQKHYEVRSDVFSKIPEKYRKFAKVKSKDQWLLDLPGYNRQQMLDQGVPSKNIEDCKICTFENRRYFSSRSGDSGRFIFGGMIHA